MANKKFLGILIGSIVVIGGSVGGYFIWQGAQNDTWNKWYPEETIPDARLTFIKSGEENITLSLETIIKYMDNQTVPKIELNDSIDDVEVPIIGFNPVEFYSIVGWNDVDYVGFEAGDGYKKSINVTDFMLNDTSYNKYPSGSPAIIAIVANNQWIKSWDVEYGDFAIRGFESGSNKVRDVINLYHESYWQIEVKINGETEFFLDSNNITTTLSTNWNYTNYEWGYYDEEDGYGWDSVNHQGFTLASIADYCNENVAGWLDYSNMTFIAFDGYGSQWSYNKTDIEDGLTPEHSINITSGGEEVLLENDGKLIIISNIIDSSVLTHYNGPYRVIIPGQSKRRYIYGISTIEIEASILHGMGG